MDASLSRAETEALRGAPLTYPEVGATRGPLPDGYHHLQRRARVGSGRERFESVARAVMTWGVQRGAGISVRESGPVAVDAVAVLRLALGPLGVDAPARVVYVVEEPHRRGFAYGTLPGHPEAGEEAFLVELTEEGVVELVITAFSRPATLLARVGGPVTRVVQRLATDRYVRAVRELG